MQQRTQPRHFFFAVTTVIFVALTATIASAAKIDPRLRKFGQGRTELNQVRVVALMAKPSGMKAPRKYDRIRVIQYLRERTRVSWKQIGSSIGREAKNEISKVHLNWITNSFSADVTSDGLKLLATTAGVTKIYYFGNDDIAFPKRERQRAESSGEVPYNLIDIGLNDLMKERPEIDGRGVILGSVDTGVDGEHPLLQGKVINFYNGEEKKRTAPKDFDSHGTHTIGTMIGGDRQSNIFGIAPGAKMVAAGALIDYDSMLDGMQFMLDPDGDPSTMDMPRAVNNSWNCRGAPDMELFYKAISAWEAAGIVPIFSAGNSGPRERTITNPKEHPSTIAVGATGKDSKITSFSSRGPALYKGIAVHKPDLAAPGEDIESTLPKQRFGANSGTSMAAPHVTGTVALIAQVAPELTPDEIRLVLTRSAIPMNMDGTPANEPQWNKVYGYGKLNVPNAIKLATRLRNMKRNSQQIAVPLSILFDSQPLSVLSSWSPNKDMADEVDIFPDEFESDGWLSAQSIWN